MSMDGEPPASAGGAGGYAPPADAGGSPRDYNRKGIRAMARFSQTMRRCAWLAPVVLLVGPIGCIGLDCFTAHWNGPPSGNVCKVEAIWIPQVVQSPDPTRNGAVMPYLGGRVFLFG